MGLAATAATLDFRLRDRLGLAENISELVDRALRLLRFFIDVRALSARRTCSVVAFGSAGSVYWIVCAPLMADDLSRAALEGIPQPPRLNWPRRSGVSCWGLHARLIPRADFCATDVLGSADD